MSITRELDVPRARQQEGRRTAGHEPEGIYRLDVHRDRMTSMVGLALSTIAAHTFVDSFVDLRPGTSPTDHLVSGTVPAIVLGPVGLAFARRRTGTTATVVALVGVAAAIGLAAAPTAALIDGRVSAGAFTGVAGLAAAALLIGIGGLELFRMRRRDGSRVRRLLRRSARALLAGTLVLLVAAPVGMGYAVANRSGPPRRVPDLGAPHDDVTIHTEDGLDLAAAYVPSQNRSAIIVFPGRAGDKVVARTRLLIAHGYGVLVIQPRGNGGSDGDPNLLGWSGEGDIRAAIRFLQQRPDIDPERIGGLGLSVGGELMIQAAAHDHGLGAIVSEGAGSRWIGDDVHSSFPESLVQLPFSTVATVATAVFSDSMPPARLDQLVDDISPRPIMLIWTSNGVGGEWFNPRYYERAGDPKTIWEIPESSHTNGLAARPVEYESRVIDFFDDAFGIVNT